MDFERALELYNKKLSDHKVMALASCKDDYPMVRMVSCIFYDGKIWFKTDKNFRKTKQLYENPKVALCWNGTQIEGTARITGLVVDEPDRRFEKLFREYYWQTYNAYAHEDTEVLVEITPHFVEIWDEDDRGYAVQTFIDFDTHEARIKPYD